MLEAPRGGLRVLAFVLALSTVLSAPAAAAAATVAFTINDSRITESSGLTRDVSGRRYWTVNDSGDKAIAYAVSRTGKVIGTLSFRAEPIDVEAVAMIGSRLYIADIGDNQLRRQFVTVYFFDDPLPDDSTIPYRAYDFEYPDGRHDAETLLVDSTGRLYIVTKGADAAIYTAPGQPSRQGVNRLLRLGDAPAYVTDGVFLPGDRRIVLRTYVSLVVLDAITYKTVARASAPAQPQGESIALSLNGRSLLLGSEGADSKVYTVNVPTRITKVPTAASTPPATPSPSPTPTPTPSTQPDTTASDANRRGTLAALGLAAVVAATAGVVAGVVGRR